MNIKDLVDLLDSLNSLDSNAYIYGVSREFDSYRGYYEHIAVAPNDTHKMSLAAFINLLVAQVGRTYTGYKGGDYTMGKQTEVFVAHYGCCGKLVDGVEKFADGYKLSLSEFDMNGF
jgi:hypothetical protein